VRRGAGKVRGVQSIPGRPLLCNLSPSANWGSGPRQAVGEEEEEEEGSDRLRWFWPGHLRAPHPCLPSAGILRRSAGRPGRQAGLMVALARRGSPGARGAASRLGRCLRGRLCGGGGGEAGAGAGDRWRCGHCQFLAVVSGLLPLELFLSGVPL
jgi:hypothetical protein